MQTYAYTIKTRGMFWWKSYDLFHDNKFVRNFPEINHVYMFVNWTLKSSPDYIRKERLKAFNLRAKAFHKQATILRRRKH